MQTPTGGFYRANTTRQARAAVSVTTMVPYVITAEHTEVAVPLGKLFLDRHAISVLCGLSVTQPALADIIHYECKADLSTGYHFDEKTRAWSPTNFIPKGKYVI